MLFFVAISPIAILLTTLMYWILKPQPKARLYRFNTSSECHLPEARKTPLHDTMAARCKLNSKVKHCLTDAERIDTLNDWVHSLWQPGSLRHAKSHNPLTIISRAKKGERFAEQDYITVLAHAMTAIGIPTRMISLGTSDMAWRIGKSRYHGLEYFDRQHFKWVWHDACENIRVSCNRQFLNCLEIKQAVLADQLLQAEPEQSIDIDHYSQKLLPYLDVIVALPLGQTRRYALIPPQLKIAHKKWLFGQKLFEVRVSSANAFYASHPIKQLTQPQLSMVRDIPARQTVQVRGMSA